MANVSIIRPQDSAEVSVRPNELYFLVCGHARGTISSFEVVVKDPAGTRIRAELLNETVEYPLPPDDDRRARYSFFGYVWLDVQDPDAYAGQMLSLDVTVTYPDDSTQTETTRFSYSLIDYDPPHYGPTANIAYPQVGNHVSRPFSAYGTVNPTNSTMSAWLEYEGSTVYGMAMVPCLPPYHWTFSFTWPPPGACTLAVKATDHNGQSTTERVAIIVDA